MLSLPRLMTARCAQSGPSPLALMPCRRNERAPALTYFNSLDQDQGDVHVFQQDVREAHTGGDAPERAARG